MKEEYRRVQLVEYGGVLGGRIAKVDLYPDPIRSENSQNAFKSRGAVRADDCGLVSEREIGGDQRHCDAVRPILNLPICLRGIPHDETRAIGIEVGATIEIIDEPHREFVFATCHRNVGIRIRISEVPCHAALPANSWRMSAAPALSAANLANARSLE